MGYVQIDSIDQLSQTAYDPLSKHLKESIYSETMELAEIIGKLKEIISKEGSLRAFIKKVRYECDKSLKNLKYPAAKDSFLTSTIRNQLKKYSPKSPELDKHSGEIANALKEADKNFLEELARWEKAQVKQVDKNVLNPGKKVSESICAEALPLGRKSVWRIITDDRRYVVALVNEDGLVITASAFTSEKDAQSACNMIASILTRYCDEDSFIDAGISKNKSTMSFKDFVEATLAKPCCLVVKNEPAYSH